MRARAPGRAGDRQLAPVLEARAVEQRLEAILETMAEAITSPTARQGGVRQPPPAAELFGAESADAAHGAQPAGHDGPLPDPRRGGKRDRPRADAAASELQRRGRQARTIRAVERSSGHERWLVARPAPVSDRESGGPLFSVNVYEDITQVKRVQFAESFMAEASRVLASSMDYDETLARSRELAVPQIADWCAVDVALRGRLDTARRRSPCRPRAPVAGDAPGPRLPRGAGRTARRCRGHPQRPPADLRAHHAPACWRSMRATASTWRC